MILPGFDTFVAIDWSGARNSYKGIAVAKCSRGRSAPKLVPSKVNAHWTRTEIADWLCDELNGASRVLVGLDFAFGFPFDEKTGYLHGHMNEQQKTVFDLWESIDDNSCGEMDFGCNTFTNDVRFAPLFWKSGRSPAGWSSRKRRTELACTETTIPGLKLFISSSAANKLEGRPSPVFAFSTTFDGSEEAECRSGHSRDQRVQR